MNVSLYVALRTWFRTTDAADRLRGLGVLLVLVCVLVAGGAGLGALVHPRVVTKTITDKQVVLTTEYKAQLVQVKGETVYKDRVITKYVYAPNGGVASKTVEEDRTADATTTTATEQASGDSKEVSDTKSTTITKPDILPRFAFDVGAGLQPLRPAGVTLLVDFSVRPFQALPLTLGAWSTVPTLDLKGSAVGAKAGVQW